MIKNSIKPLVFGAILIAIYSAVFVAYMGRIFPIIGHDFSYFMPRLIDTYLHYSINGLGIQWYTPSFGGGVPAYANPQSIQFSLVQLLTSFVNPWLATVFATIIHIFVGFFASYFFFKNLINLDWATSLLGALLFVVNGFYIQHISVGHIGFLGFTLLPVILYFLFRKTQSYVIEGILISIVLALIFYSAGIYIFVIFIFSLSLLIPLLYVFRSHLFNWKLLGLRGLIGVSWAFGLVLSKLWAMLAFTKLFPREISYYIQSSWIDGLSSIVGQLLGTMTMAPFYWLTEKSLVPFSTYFSKWIGEGHKLWEYDVSISPVLWFLIALGVFWVLIDIKNPKKLTFQQHMAVLVLILALVLTTSAITTKGFIYDFLKQLPGFKSLNVTLRYTAAFIFPLSLIGAISYNRLIINANDRKRELMLILFSIIVFIFLLPYFRVPEKYTGQWFDAQNLIDTYYSIKNGNSPMVNQILDVRDTETIPNEASNIYPHDPIFGYAADKFHPEISVGPVGQVENGYFNINNASGLLYPAINHTRPFERIKIEDKKAFNDFVQRRQPEWKRPAGQYVADLISIFCLCATIVMFILAIYKKRIQGVKRTDKSAPALNRPPDFGNKQG